MRTAAAETALHHPAPSRQSEPRRDEIRALLVIPVAEQTAAGPKASSTTVREICKMLSHPHNLKKKKRKQSLAQVHPQVKSLFQVHSIGKKSRRF